MINFENVNKDNEEWLQSDGSDLDFQNVTGMDMADVALEQKGEKQGGENESEEDG
jgi:hypothetical protein